VCAGRKCCWVRWASRGREAPSSPSPSISHSSSKPEARSQAWRAAVCRALPALSPLTCGREVQRNRASLLCAVWAAGSSYAVCSWWS
jgi:hypothetical protein